MKLIFALVLLILQFPSEKAWSQDRIFFNRIHIFEHQECQHPIGTFFTDRVFFANNSDPTSYMNFNNTELDTIAVDFVKYGSYTAFNIFPKDKFLAANAVIIGRKLPVLSQAESVREARSHFQVDTVKDTLVYDKTLKHIRIIPKDTVVHNFKSYNILINTQTKTEHPLFTAPTVHFLLKGSLKDLKGTVVETYFIDLEGYWYCRNVLTGLQLTNKRVMIK